MKFITRWIDPPTVHKGGNWYGLPEWFHWLEWFEDVVSYFVLIALIAGVSGYAFRVAYLWSKCP